MTRTRLALCFACTGLVFGAFAAGCGSSSNGNNNQGGQDGGGLDSTTGGDAPEDTVTMGQDSPVDSTSGGDSSDSTAPGDAGSTDAADGTTTDTGSQDSGTTDTGSTDGGSQDGSTDAPTTDTGTPDTGTPDSGTDGSDGAVDAGAGEAATDAAGDGPILIGPACRGADGGNIACAFGEHCCVTTATQATACAASCDGDAGSYAVDCVGSTGLLECGGLAVAPVCCATLVLDGTGSPPNCGASQLASTCAPSCGTQNPPGNSCDTLSHVIQLCTAAADCASDDAGGIARTHCCSFGTNPISWCVDGIAASQGTCK
jgi:hypothetical protein